MILKCTCTNAYQDERYGPQMRVQNFAPKHSTKSQGKWIHKGYRCTVCERTNYKGS